MAPPVIDVHAHFLTDRYVAEARSAGLDRPDGMPGWPTWTAEAHLDLMDASGIERSLLSISSPGVHFGSDGDARALAGHVNDHAAGVRDHRPDRFGFFASLPLPDVEGARLETVRALDELGADGVSMLTHHAGAYLADPRMDPLWGVLDERGALVHVHPTSPPGWELLPDRPRPMLEFPMESARSLIDLILAGVLDRYPRLRIVASHCGGAIPLLVERVDRFMGAFATDPAPRVREQLGRLWFDTAGTPFPEQLPTLVSVVGEGRVLYGSDYCFTPPGAVAGQLASMEAATAPLSAETWLELMAHNTRLLLGPAPALSD